MIYSLPYSVEIDGQTINIRNNCDFRVVLDVIEALNDDEMNDDERLRCALYIFYGEELEKISDFETATKEMMKIINGGEEEVEQDNKPQLMDWKHDFSYIAPPVSKTLGYDVRLPDRYTHWWTFLGGYMEIGECTFANIISIRSKKTKGQKLEKWEQDFYRENKKAVDLPRKLSKEEQEFLDSDW